ncbi:MAG: SulP family inorganic anion transporter [Streptosporangiaceae bacterium]
MTSGSHRTGPARVIADIIAGLQRTISSVPSGMATAVLAGVHPIQGPYTCLAGPIAAHASQAWLALTRRDGLAPGAGR